MVPRPQLQRASIALHLRVGSRYETRETNGLSHFLEHMLYRGTPRLPTSHEQALAFERLGGTLYAATATDHGVMNLTLPSETLEASIDLLGDVVRSPIFSAIEVEKGIIEEEIREDLDENDRQVDPDNLTRALLFPDHPLGYTITGTVEQLHRHDRAALERHHRRHYGAVNMVASVAGAFDVERTFAALEKALGAMPAGEAVTAEPAPGLPGKPKLLYVDSEGSQTELRVAFRGFGERHPHEPAVELLLRVIDDGMSTRLYERLCDTKGLCYDVSSTVESFADDGILDLAAETQHERAPTVVREMLELCRELAEHGPTDAEVDMVRARLTWASRAMLDDPEDLASFYGLAALSGVTPTPDARCAQLLAVSREQIRDAAAALFRPERLGVVAVGVLGRTAQRDLERTVKNFR
ncbi:MAG: insulinase family protein [Myxococcales bacterium]|nr:MAG: insulinase family protein [Myxococcales bacterium]